MTPQQLARAVECPECLALPGRVCTSRTGLPVKPSRAHRARVRAAHQKETP